MRSNHAITGEVLLRTKDLEQKRKRKAIKRSSFSAVALCCALIIEVLVVPQSAAMSPLQPATAYASLVYMGGTAGGYVAVAVVAFVLGVAIALICLYAKQKL